jgi:hypothetical protein
VDISDPATPTVGSPIRLERMDCGTHSLEVLEVPGTLLHLHWFPGSSNGAALLIYGRSN